MDLGGTKLAVAATLDRGASWERLLRIPTPRRRPLLAILELVDAVAGGRRLAGIGLSMPGPLDRRTGTALGAPNLSSAWRDLALADQLRGRHGCPVLAENDANCAALAEASRGAGAGFGTVVYFSVSTGIGTGVVHQGRLVTGRDDIEGGHHVVWPAHLGGPPCACGGAGCLEALVSGSAIRARHGVAPEQLHDEGWREVGHWLGIATVNAAMFHDPDVVVFGGGLVKAWSRWSPSVHATVEGMLRLRPAPLIRRAELGDDRNLCGALSLLHAVRSAP